VVLLVKSRVLIERGSFGEHTADAIETVEFRTPPICVKCLDDGTVPVAQEQVRGIIHITVRQRFGAFCLATGQIEVISSSHQADRLLVE